MSLDKLTAVDINRVPLAIGDTVALSVGTVIGLRADANNRNNVYVLFNSRTIKTIDPTDLLNGILDGEASLVSGFSARKLNTTQEIAAAEDATTGPADKITLAPDGTPQIPESPVTVSQPPAIP